MPSPGTKFSSKEINFLKEWAKLVSPACMAMSLKRQENEVINKLSELKLRKKKGNQEYDSFTGDWG